MLNSNQPNWQLIEPYFNEVWNHSNTGLLDELISPGHINHSPIILDPKQVAEGPEPIIIVSCHLKKTNNINKKITEFIMNNHE